MGQECFEVNFFFFLRSENKEKGVGEEIAKRGHK
jgi:hypothetical protein